MTGMLKVGVGNEKKIGITHHLSASSLQRKRIAMQFESPFRQKTLGCRKFSSTRCASLICEIIHNADLSSHIKILKSDANVERPSCV